MESERAVAEGDAGLDVLHARVARKRRGESADGDAGGDGEAAVVPPAALGWRFAVDGIYPSRHAVARFDVDVDTSEGEGEGSIGGGGSGVFDRPCLVLKGAASPFVRSAHLPTIARRFPRYIVLHVLYASSLPTLSPVLLSLPRLGRAAWPLRSTPIHHPARPTYSSLTCVVLCCVPRWGWAAVAVAGAARYTLQAVKGAGHWLHAEKPTETVHAVATFVRAVEALPAGG
jgi:hypothetical protein